MNKLTNQWHIAACVFLLIGSSLWLTSCVQYQVVAGSPLATPKGLATLTPFPTRADGQPGPVRPYRVTPLPGEKVQVGNITEVQETELVATTAPSRYSIQNEHAGVYKLFVHDSKSGQDIRLGNDDGSASFGAMTDQYVIWRFDCYTCAEDARLKTGFYAHVLATGEKIIIAGPAGYQWYPKIEGQWVIYLDVSSSNKRFATLRAHNLTTGEDFQIGKEVPYNWTSGHCLNYMHSATHISTSLPDGVTIRCSLNH